MTRGSLTKLALLSQRTLPTKHHSLHPSQIPCASTQRIRCRRRESELPVLAPTSRPALSSRRWRHAGGHSALLRSSSCFAELRPLRGSYRAGTTDGGVNTGGEIDGAASLVRLFYPFTVHITSGTTPRFSLSCLSQNHLFAPLPAYDSPAPHTCPRLPDAHRALSTAGQPYLRAEPLVNTSRRDSPRLNSPCRFPTFKRSKLLQRTPFRPFCEFS